MGAQTQLCGVIFLETGGPQTFQQEMLMRHAKPCSKYVVIIILLTCNYL